MDAFSYLSVLLSIILGLALTQLLQGLRGIALHRGRVRGWWPVLAWAAALMLMNVQAWWAMFGLRTHAHWAFVQFFAVIVHTVLLYMLAALVLPDFVGDEPVDLRVHYFAQRRLFQLTLIGAVLASLAKDLVMDGSLPSGPNLTMHVAYLVLALAALVTVREAFHKALALVVLVSFSCYTVLLFSSLAT